MQASTGQQLSNLINDSFFTHEVAAVAIKLSLALEIRLRKFLCISYLHVLACLSTAEHLAAAVATEPTLAEEAMEEGVSEFYFVFVSYLHVLACLSPA